MLEPPFLADTTALVASLLALKYLPSKGPSEATSSTVLEACLMSFTALWMPSSHSVSVAEPIHDGSDTRARALPVDALLKEFGAFLQVHEESTNLFDGQFVNVRELSAQQLLG
jgi:hypothetical protein